MESDISYLVNRLGNIDGFGDTGDYLGDIVKSKKPTQAPTESNSDEKSEVKENDSKDAGMEVTVDEDVQNTATDATPSN